MFIHDAGFINGKHLMSHSSLLLLFARVPYWSSWQLMIGLGLRPCHTWPFMLRVHEWGESLEVVCSSCLAHKLATVKWLHKWCTCSCIAYNFMVHNEQPRS